MLAAINTEIRATAVSVQRHKGKLKTSSEQFLRVLTS